MSERESMPYDIVIVGGGPAGLSAAIRLKQRAVEAGREISVCILEKGSEIGAHILSGAVIDPKGLDELLPDWREMGCPLAQVPVSDNHHWFLTKSGKMACRTSCCRRSCTTRAAITGSLGALCRWLAEQAEALGVEIFPGFPAAEILFNADGSVKGVATGEMGVARDGFAQGRLPAGAGASCPLYAVRRGRAGASHQAAQGALQSGSELRSADLWAGIKELWISTPRSMCRGASSIPRAGRFQMPMAAASSIIRQAGRWRSASWSGSATATRISAPMRSSSAGKHHPRDPRGAGGRQARLLRCAGHQRRRLPVDPGAGHAGRGADRLRGRASSMCRASRARIRR